MTNQPVERHRRRRRRRRSRRARRQFFVAVATVIGVLAAVGAAFAVVVAIWVSKGAPSLKIYSDVPRSIVDPIVRKFERQRHITVTVEYADPASVNSGEGMSERIRNESSSPKADIYWSACPIAVEQLRQDSLLEPHGTDKIAKMFQGPQSSWWAVGARVRVIIFNKHKLNANTAPKSIGALIRPEWMGRCAIADPLKNGSSRYHIYCLFASMTTSEARRILESMKSNHVQFLPTDDSVIDAVCNGKADWGIVYSDFAYHAWQAGRPINYAVTDQETYSTQDALSKPRSSIPTIGTPLLALAVALLRNRPHKTEVYDLVNYLFSEGVAVDVTESDPALIPTSYDIINNLHTSPGQHVINPSDLKTPPVSIANIDAEEPEANKALSEVFEGE